MRQDLLLVKFTINIELIIEKESQKETAELFLRGVSIKFAQEAIWYDEGGDPDTGKKPGDAAVDCFRYKHAAAGLLTMLF
ncbi:MAG: hypothetical protein C4589_12445 [Peptococcaceae bacterium]|nr:MAG: hypothetical protein C4589_12445 [Peptococcaceae bacterium]